MENKPVGSKVAMITAVDLDEDQLHYNISGAHAKLFTVDNMVFANSDMSCLVRLKLFRVSLTRRPFSTEKRLTSSKLYSKSATLVIAMLKFPFVVFDFD